MLAPGNNRNNSNNSLVRCENGFYSFPRVALHYVRVYLEY